MAIKPYGVAIQQAVVSGNLKNMKAVAKAAEQHLAQYGDVGTSLALLKMEIAKLEGK
ncbi:MAG TPA: DUF1843 domain-containing protein [Rhizomicrobium sp.]|jgi:hypothetical protein|nr:DUF1843 domain-containing protein [Rhizomicrobium sp.]